MNGLEAVQIKLSELNVDNRIFRFDSTFFLRDSLKHELKVLSLPHFFLKGNEVVSGPFGSTLKSHSYLTSGIPFIRIENIKGGFEINKSEIVYISEDNNNLLANSKLHLDDVVLSKVGNSIGYYARVDEEVGVCNISENNLGIKLTKYEREHKHFILAFLNSRYGQIMTLRRISGNAQPKLNVADVNEIPIPVVGKTLQKRVSEIILLSRENSLKSQSTYDQSQSLLFQELGLEKWKPSKGNTEIKSFKHSLLKSGRLDAEYYQPKYDELMNIIRSSKHKRLEEIVQIKKSIEPGSEAYQRKGIPFIRVSDVSQFGITKAEHYLDEEKFDLGALQPKKDTILLSKDGSVGIAFKVEENLNVITSSALLHLTVVDEKVMPDYLTLVLNSKLTQLQAQRDAGGSIIQHWRPTEIKQVLIPILPLSTQVKLVQLIHQSFNLRKTNRLLLDSAKEAVEMAIEQGEDKALEYLSQIKLELMLD